MLLNCPFCHHERAAIYRAHQELRGGGYKDIYRCEECGTIYPRPRMEAEEINKYISELDTNQKNIEYYNKYYAGAYEYIRYDYFIQRLLKKWVPFEGKALDIGAFIGRFCQVLEGVGFNTFGLEPQERASRFARSQGIKVYTGSFPDRIPHALLDIKFTLISMMESIYYTIDLDKCLYEVNSMLKENGFFLIQCHQGKASYYERTDNSFFKRYGNYVQGIPTEDSLRYCLRKSGFRVVHVSALPKDFVSIFYKGKKFKNVLNVMSLVVHKIYEKTFLNLKEADKLVLLAKKI